MGNHLLNILPVRADQVTQRHIIIPDPNLPAFAEETFHKLDLWALPQIVGGSFKA